MNLIAAIPYDAFMFGPFKPLGDFTIGGFGPLEIHSFGLLVAIGLMVTFTVTSKRAEKKLGISGEEFQNFGIYLVAIGWFFSHVFDVLFYTPEKILEDPLILFKVWGQISSYGGLIGGIIGAYVYRWRHPHIDFPKMVDLAAYGLTFPWMFGRFGCASVHDHPGHTTDFFLGIEWTDGTVRHDLGFYEAIWWVVIVVVVLITDRKPRPTYFFIALVGMMYAPARFMLDFLRVPPELGGDVRYFGLTPGQYLSVLLFFVALYFFNKVRKNDPIEWVEYVPPADTSSKSDKKK